MTTPLTRRGLAPHRDSDRGDLSAFVARAQRADDSGVLRAKQRPDGRVGLWVRTGFDVLATRSVFGVVEPTDAVCDVGVLAASLAAGDDPLDIGFAMPSAWQGALPGDRGFVHLDDVPARDVIGLARRGAELARDESGALGPAPSLLDQKVLTVSGGDSAARAEGSGDGPGDSVDVTMRAVFALTAMGFVRDADGHEITDESPLAAIAADEPVRVRASGAWVRIDARFGSVYQRRAVLDLGVV